MQNYLTNKIIFYNANGEKNNQPMDVVPCFQIFHGLCHLHGHVKKHDSADRGAVGHPQIFQQISFAHEFCDDVERRFQRANACKNHYKVEMGGTAMG